MKMDVIRDLANAEARPKGPPRQEWRDDVARPFRLGMLAAWLTLVASLALTGWAWHLAKADAEQEARSRFDFRVSELKSAVRARMQAYEQVLRGARALFEASDVVTRNEWHAYVKSLRIEESFPGIQGVGFARRIAPAELEAHTAQIRAEGFPDYSVHPAGNRSEYTSIIYLEPFDWRNRRAFGYDMFAHPVRRDAMEQARDTGEMAISGKVTLVQETDKDVQAGFLMYLPVYRQAAAADTVERRREALLGYVYSPFRMRDLMTGIIGRDLDSVDLEIYDGNELSRSALLYDSNPARGTRLDERPAFENVETLDINHHPWTLLVTSLPPFEATIPRQKSRLMLQGGTAISLLLFMLVWSQVRLRKRAMALAGDITAALKESREQFRAVAETANAAIVSAGAQGRIVYFNDAAQRMFGYPEREAVGQPLTLLMPERFQAQHQAGFERLLSTGESRLIGKTIELAGRRKDGSEFPIEISLANWTTAKGTFFTAILHDTTERRRAEEQIRRLNGELERQIAQLAAVNRELEGFSYSVSHDLRAPLRAIDGFARFLEEDYGDKLDEEGRRLLGVIRESSRKMGQLIDDLLAFARLGRTSVSSQGIDMTALANEVLKGIREAGDAQAATCSIGAMPPARGDRSLLHQVWMNLLDNAVKYSRTKDHPVVEAGGYSAAGENVYYVKDNGVGFDMQYAGKLFGVFRRLHSPEQFPGTGVGLAIVQRIVAKHGGRVWAEGKVDEGAAFYFSLPRGEEHD